MKLVADWGVTSARLDRLLERGCCNYACAGELGRLVRHPVPTGTQIWLSCCACGSRLGGALPHREHPLRAFYPVWREGGCDYLLPEEPRPLTLAQMMRAVFEGSHPILREAHVTSIRTGLFIADGLPSAADVELALGTGEAKVYISTELQGEGRLLSVEAGLIRMLTPQLIGQKVRWGRAQVVADGR